MMGRLISKVSTRRGRMFTASSCMNVVLLGPVKAFDLPCPQRLYTRPPQSRREHSSAGKLRHWLIDPSPSCRNTSVGASDGDGPCHAYSSRAPSTVTKSCIPQSTLPDAIG